jgi:hypothetical protein
MIPTVKFNQDDANRAYTEWGANCGPGALAAITHKTLDEVRPYLGDFEKKHYTNPRLMFATLRRMGIEFTSRPGWNYPDWGLIRVQWEGPWTAPGVPLHKRYRHSHWVGTYWDVINRMYYFFDINYINLGGWLPFAEWEDYLVPWLLRQCEPDATGGWFPVQILHIKDGG